MGMWISPVNAAHPNPVTPAPPKKPGCLSFANSGRANGAFRRADLGQRTLLGIEAEQNLKT